MYMIVPHKNRIFDRKQNSTTVAELVQRHKQQRIPNLDGWPHYSFWTTKDFVDFCRHFKWHIIAIQDVDDKVGNGFTVVLQKVNK